jgi:hypothetical protein
MPFSSCLPKIVANFGGVLVPFRFTEKVEAVPFAEKGSATAANGCHSANIARMEYRRQAIVDANIRLRERVKVRVIEEVGKKRHPGERMPTANQANSNKILNQFLFQRITGLDSRIHPMKKSICGRCYDRSICHNSGKSVATKTRF